MSAFLQAIIRPIWELLVFIPMPWRSVIVLLVLMPVLSWLFWRAFPWLLAKISQLFFVFAEILATILLLIEYSLTQSVRKHGHKPPEVIYIFDDLLSGIVSSVNEVSQQLNKMLRYVLQKRWFPRKVGFIIAGIILIFTWYLRPIFGEATVAKLIDSGAMRWYSFEGWVLNEQWKPYALSSRSPEQFIKAYYSAINNRQYPAAWSCLSTKLQSIKLPAPPGFIKLKTDKSLMQPGFISYVGWLEPVERVEIKKITIAKENKNSARMNIRLQYFVRENKKLSGSESLRLWLVWDSRNSRWIINGSKVIS